jgi:hypothetical protein
MEVYMGNLKRVDRETLKITTTDLVGTLEANALMLVGDCNIPGLEAIK